ncbi:MAG: DUF86 domain-containing protein [Clostridia bacterium]|nr:DUF86 domain-containing protein [Clostridia bacterium]
MLNDFPFSTYDDFLSNQFTCDGYVYNVGLIGEATSDVDAEFRKTHPEIPWYQIANLRHRLFHEYEGTRFDIVWQIITEDLPPLREQLAALLEEITTTKG